jgi:hypothetical protein
VSLPVPRPGLVIRYAYLWAREFDAGRTEGAKDRPCAVVLTLDKLDRGTTAYVLPITRSQPSATEKALEIPRIVKDRLGLDAAKSWVVLTEANTFVWPGPDLRPIPGRGVESVACGFLPPALFRQLRDRFVGLARAGKVKVVDRE